MAFKFSRDQFFASFRTAFGPLNATQVSGLNDLLNQIENDISITDIRHFAYMLATAKHETWHTFKPIEEKGKGAGKPYGVLIDGHAYYGRGDVQLTWIYNYRKFAKLLGVDLVGKPELALDPGIAYSVMSVGMRAGLFTGKKLSDYINDTRCDYVNARRIINGLDQADAIADIAVKFETILKGSLLKI